MAAVRTIEWAYLREAISHLLKFFDSLIPPAPVAPGVPILLSKSEIFTNMASLFRYEIAHPEIAQEDTTVVRLHCTVDGAAMPNVDGDPGTTFTVDAAPNVSVVLYFTSLDAAGNESIAGPSLSFVAVDDIPPSAPGAPAVLSHTEVFTPDPVAPPDPPVGPTPPIPVVPGPQGGGDGGGNGGGDTPAPVAPDVPGPQGGGDTPAPVDPDVPGPQFDVPHPEFH